MSVSDKNWRITFSGVISSLILLAFDATPIPVLIFVRPFGGAVLLACFLALSFWFPSYRVLRLSLESRQLPTITGGPRFRANHRRNF